MLEQSKLKLYSVEAAEKLIESITNIDLKEIKGATTYDFEVVATVEVVDRDGEVVQVSGMDTTNYMKNPVILWGHNYWNVEALVGKATEVLVQDGQVIVRGVFASTESAQVVKQLYDDGVLKAVSIGFIPKEIVGNLITKWELLELSFVSVPSNPDALSTESKAALNKLDQMIKTVVVNDDSNTEEPNKDDINGGQNNPKEPDNAPEDEEAKEKGIKSGRVISQKNREILSRCLESMKATMDCLQELMDATEPEKSVIADAANLTVEHIQSIQKIMEDAVKTAKKVRANI